MKSLLKYGIASVVAVVLGCSKDSDPAPVEGPLAVAQVGARVISTTGTKLVFEHDFFIYNEDGLFGEDRFTVSEDRMYFAEDGWFDIDAVSVEKVQAEPKGCYSTAILMEQNPMERPDRPEQLVRSILKNTDPCSNFLLSTYPERTASLAQAGEYEIFGNAFINDATRYDQDLATIAGNNYQLFKQNKGVFNTQFRALDAITQFVANEAGNDNKHVFVVYQNFADRATALSDKVRDYAIANGIAIHGVKNDYSADDELFRISHATGGIYFMPADYDPFHEPGKSDYYAMAKHMDKFLSGNYTFYRVRYELTASRDYFYSGMQFYMSTHANLTGTVDLFGDEEKKLIPVYVPVP